MNTPGSASTAVRRVRGTALALRGDDIDTDRIIPARFMRCITFDGLGERVFYDERFKEDGSPKKHPFNDPLFSGATILIAGANFGCGSSREHAPQALMRFGFRAIVACSFADIFAANCASMGIVAGTVNEQAHTTLMATVETAPATILDLDLESERVIAGEHCVPLNLYAPWRKRFLEGTWDTTATLLANREAIAATARSLPPVAGY